MTFFQAMFSTSRRWALRGVCARGGKAPLLKLFSHLWALEGEASGRKRVLQKVIRCFHRVDSPQAQIFPSPGVLEGVLEQPLDDALRLASDFAPRVHSDSQFPSPGRAFVRRKCEPWGFFAPPNCSGSGAPPGQAARKMLFLYFLFNRWKWGPRGVRSVATLPRPSRFAISPSVWCRVW